MLKRIITAAAVATLVGCGTSQSSTTTSGSSSSTTGSHTTSTTTGTNSGTATAGNSTSSSNGSSTTSGNGTTTATDTSTTSTNGSSTSSGNGSSTSSGAGSTSGTTGACVTDDIPTVRSPATPLFTNVCVNGVTVVYANNAGNAADGGGTQYNGEYYVADSNANAIEVFKTKYASPIFDPTRGESVNVQGITKLSPADGGATATIEIAGLQLAITDNGPGTLPATKTPAFADLDHASPNAAFVGTYVTVPAGQWTENAADPAMAFHASNGNTYQDGFSLTDGTHTLYVDTYDLGKGAADKSCLPSDGGMPDFSAGGFKAIFDYGLAPNSTQNAVLYFGDCSDKAQ